MTGWFFVADDLEELELEFTPWLWPEINYVLQWEVPR